MELKTMQKINETNVDFSEVSIKYPILKSKNENTLLITYQRLKEKKSQDHVKKNRKKHMINIVNIWGENNL